MNYYTDSYEIKNYSMYFDWEAESKFIDKSEIRNDHKHKET